MKKMGMDIKLTENHIIREAIRKGIGAAEEWAQDEAMKLLGRGDSIDGEDSNLPSPSAKIGFVVTAAQYSLKMQGIKNVLPEDLRLIIQEEIAFMPGVGATGDNLLEK